MPLGFDRSGGDYAGSPERQKREEPAGRDFTYGGLDDILDTDYYVDMTSHTAAKNLEVFTASAYTDQDGNDWPAMPLYRYVDANGKGGPRHNTIEQAEKSWQRKHPA